MAFETLAPQVISRLSADLQLTPQQAAGIVGQLGYESEGLQAINERNPVVPGSRGGFGWAQWTGPRRQAFEQFAQQKGLNVADPEANYQFLLSELTEGPESRVVPMIRTAQDAQTAGRIFTDQFLRPGVPAYDKRQSWTEKALNFIIPAAQAGAVDDEWAELEKRFSAGGTPTPASAPADDPWAELEQRFAPPKAETAPPVTPPGTSTTVGQDGVLTVNMAHENPAPQPQERSTMDRLGRQVGLTARAGISGLAALPSMLWNGPVNVMNQYLGTNIPRSDLGPAMDAVGLPSPENGTERVAQDVASAMAGTGGVVKLGQQLAGAVSPIAAEVGKLLSQGAGTQVATAGASAGSSGTAREAGVGVGGQMAAGLLGGVGTSVTMTGLANRNARLAAEKAVPQTQILNKRASALYEDAKESGVTATQQQTQKLAAEIRKLAKDEGLISPTGRVSEAYPKALEAMRLLDDYAEGTMNVPQMQSVRKVLSSAAQSSDSAERRMASLMLSRFDDFTAPLSPQLAMARALYARAKRGEQLETLRELAESRTGQFSGSGFENALRTEYRQLNNKIIKGQERGWTKEQAEAIKRVAEGTALSNALRGVGKLAPTGVVSFGLGGGVPFTVGNALGGPALGAALSGASMGGGFLARDAATRMSKRYADIAELLARSGQQLQPQRGASVSPALIQAILGTNTAGR